MWRISKDRMKSKFYRKINKIRKEIITLVKCKNIIGEKYNHLKVISREPDYITKGGRGYARWLCECDCANKTRIIVNDNHLKYGHTVSCGCIKGRPIERNKYDLSGKYGIGYTDKNEEFYFDLDDYDKIEGLKWNISNGYVCSSCNKNKRSLSMHRLVLGLKDENIDVDHINGNLSRNDNRKCNLRKATRSQNKMNVGLTASNTSGVKGVYFDKRRLKWIASIKKDRKNIYLGGYSTIEEAKNTRRSAENKIFKEFSYKWDK